MNVIEQLFYFIGVLAVSLLVSLLAAHWLGICRFEIKRTDEDDGPW